MQQLLNEKPKDFTADSQHGTWQLSEQQGKQVVLYFYPRDNTPGCTLEARDFQQLLPEFAAVNTIVVGVSLDSVQKHCQFADKQGLAFTLLADTDKQIVEQFGVYQEKSFMGKKHMGIVRTTFLLDEAGVVRQIFEKVKVKGHAQAVLAAAQALYASTH